MSDFVLDRGGTKDQLLDLHRLCNHPAVYLGGYTESVMREEQCDEAKYSKRLSGGGGAGRNVRPFIPRQE